MSTAVDYITELLSLPRADRSYLASKLIESLDEERELSPEVLDELDRRVARVESGECEAVSLESVRAKVQHILAK